LTFEEAAEIEDQISIEEEVEPKKRGNQGTPTTSRGKKNDKGCKQS